MKDLKQRFLFIDRDGTLIEEPEDEQIDAFEKLKWDKDVFEAEYLTKKTKEEQTYENINETISNLIINSKYYPIFKKQILSDNTSYVVKRNDDLRKNVPNYMREELIKRKIK